MMEKLSRFSVSYPVTVMMGVLAVLLLGYISFSNLGMDLFPDLNNPRIYISAQAGEKPPEENPTELIDKTLKLERDIADGLEKLLKEVEAVK